MKSKLTFWGCLLVLCVVVMGCTEILNSGLFNGDGTQDTPISMTIDKWFDGKIVHPDEGGSGEQWFSFRATASEHYFYVKFSTLTNLNAYLYDEDENIIGTYEHMYGKSGDIKSFTRLVKKGKKYYVKVTQGDYKSNTSSTGSFWIGFTDFPARPEKNIIMLTKDSWENSTINPKAGGDSYNWYTFVATTSEQYIHVKFSTMTNINAYLYDKDLNIIGDYEHLYGDSSDIKSFSRIVDKDGKYYLKLTQGDSKNNTSSSGSYWITFNESEVAPE